MPEPSPLESASPAEAVVSWYAPKIGNTKSSRRSIFILRLRLTIIGPTCCLPKHPAPGRKDGLVLVDASQRRKPGLAPEWLGGIRKSLAW